MRTKQKIELNIMVVPISEDGFQIYTAQFANQFFFCGKNYKGW